MRRASIRMRLTLAAGFIGGLTLHLSAVFGDPWPPLLITLCLALALAIPGPLLHVPGRGFYGLMSGEAYFQGGRPPWPGLLGTAALSAVLLVGAFVTFRRRDV